MTHLIVACYLCPQAGRHVDLKIFLMDISIVSRVFRNNFSRCTFYMLLLVTDYHTECCVHSCYGQ